MINSIRIRVYGPSDIDTIFNLIGEKKRFYHKYDTVFDVFNSIRLGSDMFFPSFRCCSMTITDFHQILFSADRSQAYSTNAVC